MDKKIILKHQEINWKCDEKQYFIKKIQELTEISIKKLMGNKIICKKSI